MDLGKGSTGHTRRVLEEGLCPRRTPQGLCQWGDLLTRTCSTNPLLLLSLRLNCCCLDTKSCLTRCDPMNVARQVPLSMGFPKQEYWSGQPFPSPGDLPDPGIKPACPVSPALAGGFFTTEPAGRPIAPTHWRLLKHFRLFTHGSCQPTKLKLLRLMSFEIL